MKPEEGSNVLNKWIRLLFNIKTLKYLAATFGCNAPSSLIHSVVIRYLV